MTAEALRIRVYNVLFGDAVLVSVPDHDDAGSCVRHILFDVGNVLGGPGSANDVFEPIFKDVLAELKGRPLDLYVMTHEHLDHVEGPLYAAKKGLVVRAETVWMTASAEGDAYYANHPDAKIKKRSLTLALEAMRPLVAADASERFRTMLLNNDAADSRLTAATSRTGTATSVAHIRDAMKTATGAVHFVYQGYDVSKAHPFRDVEIKVLAPAEDTSVYYGRPRPFRLGVDAQGAEDAGAPEALVDEDLIKPPAGVDAGAFYDLVRARRGGFPETLLAIDKAANNTSVVLQMTWRGRTLLFCGDAELASWRRMLAAGALPAVDFLKIGHHGSHNGTPLDHVSVLFPDGPDPTDRHVAVSTCCGAYNGVPHEITLAALRSRATVHDTRDVPQGKFIDIFIPPA